MCIASLLVMNSIVTATEEPLGDGWLESTLARMADPEDPGLSMHEWTATECLGASELLFEMSESDSFSNLNENDELFHAAHRFASYGLNRADEARADKDLLARLLILKAVTSERDVDFDVSTTQLVEVAPQNGVAFMLRASYFWHVGDSASASEFAERALNAPHMDTYAGGRLARVKAAIGRIRGSNSVDVDVLRQLIRRYGFVAEHAIRENHVDMIVAMQESGELDKDEGVKIDRYLALIAASDPIGTKQFSLSMLYKRLSSNRNGGSVRRKLSLAREYYSVARLQAVEEARLVRSGSSDALRRYIDDPIGWWESTESYRADGFDFSLEEWGRIWNNYETNDRE